MPVRPLRAVKRAIKTALGLRRPVEVRIPGGQPIEIVAYYDDFEGYYPTCEMATKAWLVENVGEDWVLLDCGANVGYYSLLFSRLAPEGRVFAFEPTSTHDMLLANLRHHRAANVEPLRLALSATPGRRTDRLARLWGSGLELGEWPFTTIDAFVAERTLERVDCIKIDVDGHDFEVLQGAEQTLARFDPWLVVELADVALSLRQRFATQALAWLARRGYGEALVLEECNYLLKRSASLARFAPGAPLTLRFR